MIDQAHPDGRYFAHVQPLPACSFARATILRDERPTNNSPNTIMASFVRGGSSPALTRRARLSLRAINRNQLRASQRSEIKTTYQIAAVGTGNEVLGN